MMLVSTGRVKALLKPLCVAEAMLPLSESVREACDGVIVKCPRHIENKQNKKMNQHELQSFSLRL